MSQTLKSAVEHVIKQYANHSLYDLTMNEKFIDAIRTAGQNKSENIIRRWSFKRAKPTLEVSEDKSTVQLGLKYGYGASTVLYTVERTVVVSESESVSIYVPDQNAPLSSLEDEINGFAETSGWKFPAGDRDLPLKHFLSQERPYDFDLRIIIDTLSTYAEFNLNIIMKFMDINDAISQLNHAHYMKTGKQLPDAFDLRMGCTDELDYPNRYKIFIQQR